MSEARRDAGNDWPPEAVQRLRAHLGLSQADLAARVGTRQQTISEWETGARAPRRMSRRLLRMVAEASGLYDVPAGGLPRDDAPGDGMPGNVGGDLVGDGAPGDGVPDDGAASAPRDRGGDR